jgi:hypothetical protein
MMMLLYATTDAVFMIVVVGVDREIPRGAGTK